MSGIITALVGGGAFLLLGGVAFILSRHHHRFPRKASPWIMRIAVVLMLLAGTLGPGVWVNDIFRAAGAQLGGAGGVLLALVALTLLLGVGLALYEHPTTKAMWMALILPVICASFGGGLFHDVSGILNPLAQQVSGSLTSFLGV